MEAGSLTLYERQSRGSRRSPCESAPNAAPRLRLFCSVCFESPDQISSTVLDALISAPFVLSISANRPIVRHCTSRKTLLFPYIEGRQGTVEGSHSKRDIYTLSGREFGSAADSTVYADTRRKGPSLPSGKLRYIDDPTRHHLRGWGHTQQICVARTVSETNSA